MSRVDIHPQALTEPPGGGGMRLSESELERRLGRLVGATEQWAGLVSHSAAERVCHQICDEEAVNAWLICWDEDQDTGYHDHDDSAAAIAVIAGHVREDRLRLAGPPETRTFGPGARISLPASAIHRVLHAGDRPAVTIHAYSPPLRRTGAYAVTPDGILQRTALTSETQLRAEPALIAGVAP